MDRLARTDFLRHLWGGAFQSHHAALPTLAPTTTRHADATPRQWIDAGEAPPVRSVRRSSQRS